MAIMAKKQSMGEGGGAIALLAPPGYATDIRNY